MAEIDQAAELYVANVFVNAGWNVYFPHKDNGFDFIITKSINKEIIIRPVQVKGKYPTEIKIKRKVYGFVGPISSFHDEMVLAIPFYESEVDRKMNLPKNIAYMPFNTIKKHTKGYRCEPCRYDSKPIPRKEYIKFFDEEGIKNIENRKWKMMKVKESEET